MCFHGNGLKNATTRGAQMRFKGLMTSSHIALGIDVPADRDAEITALKIENANLKVGLRRCRVLVEEWRSKFAANANENYRPPYDSDPPLFYEEKSGG